MIEEHEIYDEIESEDNYEPEIDSDHLRDLEIDRAMFCESNEEALTINPQFRRYLMSEYRYFIYTHDCEQINEVPMSYDDWQNKTSK